jgi:cell division protease FtsH
MDDFEMAKDKVLMGKERRSLILTDEEKRTTAYHEAGHALVAKLTKGSDPVHKVSIIPRGRALGVTMQLPEDDRHTYSREFLTDSIVMLMGGRVAEEIILNQLTTGAGNDIERATGVARKMVCKWGMSDKLGPLSYGEKDEEIFLGRELVAHKNFSEDTSRLIDAEVRAIVEGCHARAKALLSDNVDVLHAIAKALLERETISGADIDLIMNGQDLPPVEIKADVPKDVKPQAETEAAPDGAADGGADGGNPSGTEGVS